MLAELAYDPAYGARPVERTIDRMVLSDLSRLIIGGEVQPGFLVQLTPEGDEISILVGTPDEVRQESMKLRAKQAPRPASPSPLPATS